MKLAFACICIRPITTLRLTLFVLMACLAMTVQARLLSSGSVSLAGDIDVLLDPGSALSVRDLRQPGVAAQFVRLPGQPSLGYISGAAWLRLTLERPASAPSDWWLEVQAPLLDEARLFTPAPGGVFTERAAGTAHPFAQRDINYRSPVFALTLPADAPQTFYLRVQGNNTMAMRLRVSTPAVFATRMNTEGLMMGLFIAVHLVVMLSSLWLYQASHDRAYGLLSLLSLTNVICFSALEGLAFQYLFPGWPGWVDRLLVLSWMSAGPLYALFVFHYVDLAPARHLWVRRYLWCSWTISAVCATAVLTPYFSVASMFFQGWSLLNMLALPIGLILLARRGNTGARLLLLSTAVLLIGTGIRLNRNLGFLPSGLLQDYAYYIGMMAHLLAMNYAASRRYRHLRQAKEEAQALALQLSQNASHQLEAQVAKRTHALQQALARVETSLSAERQAKEDQHRFFETVSHELRTPLAVIDAAARNLALDASARDEPARRRAEKIQRATAQLAVLVKTCFHEDRFELLHQGPQCQLTDLHDLLLDVRESALLQSPQHDVQIDAGDLPLISCDPEMTLLTLNTLASNAIKYTPPGTRIVLHGDVSDQGITLEVRDNGPGVLAADLPHLFRRYYRGKNARFIPGTGLGLPLARELMQIQGGSLTIHSAPAQGFLARAWLPAPS